jgi:thiamine kinase-like enzyme
VPIRAARALGRALAAIHAQTPPDDETLLHQPPWPLFLHQPSLALLREASPANLGVIRILQRFPELCSHLERVRASWRRDAFIHFDLKWDNILTQRRGRAFDVRIIDLELFGVGDSSWDVGSVLSEFLGQWVHEYTERGRNAPRRNLPQPAARCFWESYAHDLGFDGSAAAERLLRSVEFAAARLVQTAYEEAHGALHVSDWAICALQLSLNIFRRPHDALAHLVGLGPIAWRGV